jgi:elongation factor Ts
MSAITASAVQDLRNKTGAGMMDCKKALAETKGDVEKAIEYLRKKGVSAAEKKAGRETKQGSIMSYIHGGGRIGVLVEINCETDFVARNENFQNFARDIAMHVAATNPRFLNRESVPANILDAEKEIHRAQLRDQKKPEAMMDKIIEGKLNRFYEENCLLEQAFVKNPDVTISDYLKETIAKIGENIVVTRYVRFELGQQAAA